MQLTKPIKTIGIIGAGIAGLAAGRILKQAGFNVELFEQGQQVGGVWSSGYHTFGLQTPKSLYEIPDYPMPDSYPRVPSGEEVQAYFENYAKDFQIFELIRFNTHIDKLEQRDDRWVIFYTDLNTTAAHQKIVDFAVVTTGLYFDPYIPKLPGQDSFQGQILHTSQYRSPLSVTGRNVAVVGFGKSALDVVGEVAKFAKQTTLIYRQAHWPIPMDIFDVLDVRRIYLTRLACAFLPLYQRPASWQQQLHHYFPWLVSGFWRFTEQVIKLQYPLKATNTLPSTPFETDIFNLDFLPRKAVYQLMQQGVIQNHRTNINAFTANGLELENGQHITCDTVIFGTGYQPNTRFLPDSFHNSQESDGVYLYRHIIHPDLNHMAFIGRAATFSNSLTAHLASAWLAHWLQGHFKLPERDSLLQEIDNMKRWKRSFMPALAGRSTVIKLHMTHYHDELLQDLAVNPYRKSNVLAEWLQDYRPSDYQSVLQAVRPY